MPFNVFPTTAENIIGATDATIQSLGGATEDLVAEFLDVPLDSARNALQMACQLSLISESAAGVYIATNPYSTYLVTANIANKAAILRLVLELYQPYKTFTYRLAISGLAADAANQTRTIYNIPGHRENILNTFVSLGTFANSLTSAGAGLYRVMENNPRDYLAILNEVIQDRDTAEIQVRRRLGREAADWINQQEVFHPLVTAYQRASDVMQDTRTPIVHAGNAIESFLVQIAQHVNVNIQNATGLNAKAETLARGHALTTKHLNMMKYLGHIRNAADHGTDPDPDIGQTWEISPNTSVEYVHIAQSAIRVVVAHVINGRFIV